MGTHDNGGASFGSCCDSLHEAIHGGEDEEFEPLITISEKGVLYMTVGLLELDGEEPGMMDHPLFFCPFCGARVQTAEEVQAKDNNSAQ